jgi:hypothetical protein
MGRYPRVHLVLPLAIVSAIISVIAAIMIVDADPIIGMNQRNVATAASMPFTVDIHVPPAVEAGDAVFGAPHFRVEPHWMDNFGERHCEECMMIEFTPRGKGYAGGAFLADKIYDFSEAKRVVFFVMGEKGGEEVVFSFAGADMPPRNAAAKDIFQNQEFGVMTKKVTLTDDLKRYEVSLEGADPNIMKQVKYPFAFQIDSNDKPTTVRFYITGVFIDTIETSRPMPTEELTP